MFFSGKVPVHHLHQHLFQCLSSKLVVEEDQCIHTSTKEDKEDDDKAAKHAARLGAGPALSEVGELGEEPGDEEDGHEVCDIGVVSLSWVQYFGL